MSSSNDTFDGVTEAEVDGILRSWKASKVRFNALFSSCFACLDGSSRITSAVVAVDVEAPPALSLFRLGCVGWRETMSSPIVDN